MTAPAANAAATAQPKRAEVPDALARLIQQAGSGQSKDDGKSGPDRTDVLVSTKAQRDDESRALGRDNAEKVARRFLVQVGAFSNVQSARTVSDRVMQAGLRPYQETVKTAQGDWIRVRIGPFASRQDAERAQQDLKRAGVTAAIIAL